MIKVYNKIAKTFAMCLKDFCYQALEGLKCTQGRFTVERVLDLRKPQPLLAMYQTLDIHKDRP